MFQYQGLKFQKEGKLRKKAISVRTSVGLQAVHGDDLLPLAQLDGEDLHPCDHRRLEYGAAMEALERATGCEGISLPVLLMRQHTS